MANEENIKIIGEVKESKVIIASCRWATSKKFHSCGNKLNCKNFIYAVCVSGKDPHIIGWCHDLNLITQRATGELKMLQAMTKEKPWGPSTHTQRAKSATTPGYL